MNLVVTGVVARVLGTLMMDFSNLLGTRTGMLSRIELGMIGRMAAGWARGRFRYGQPSEMEQIAKQMLYRYVTHYTIGVGLAVPYVFGWALLVGGPVSPVWALAYGVATTVASYCFVFRSMGLGVFGRRSPEGIRAPLEPLCSRWALCLPSFPVPFPLFCSPR